MLFEDQTTGQDTNQSANTQTTEDWLAKVVETKGDKFKDVQVLAKSKYEADTYIKELERQLKELREETSKQDYAKELFTRLQDKGTDTTKVDTVGSNNTNGGTNPSETKPVLSEDIIKTLVEQTLTQRERQNTAAQNAALVRQELVSKFGTEAKAYVERKASELGMTYNRLSEIAQESPNAFFTLIGEEKKDFKPLTQGSVNTAAASLQAPASRDFKFYQELRRKNKALYYDPKTQQQMFQDKLRLGDKFGN
jgi:hypothetical protein